MVKQVACEVVSQLVLVRLVCLGVYVGDMAVAATMPRMNEVTAAPAMMPFSEVLDCLRSVSSSVFVGIVLYSMMPGLMFGACAGASSAAAARAARARYAKPVACASTARRGEAGAGCLEPRTRLLRPPHAPQR